jgi:hypothetical protein
VGDAELFFYVFVAFPGHQAVHMIKEDFYRIAGRLTVREALLISKSINIGNMINSLIHPADFPNVIGAIESMLQ